MIKHKLKSKRMDRNLILSGDVRLLPNQLGKRIKGTRFKLPISAQLRLSARRFPSDISLPQPVGSNCSDPAPVSVSVLIPRDFKVSSSRAAASRGCKWDKKSNHNAVRSARRAS